MTFDNPQKRIIWTSEDDRRQNDFYAMMSRVPTPEWVVNMHKHYNEHGFYRPEDLQRVLGDQTRGVSVPRTTQEARDYLLGKLEKKAA
jgi:hypothetical protein